MSFRERFRDHIESQGRHSPMSLGQPINKQINPAQVHRDTPPAVMLAAQNLREGEQPWEYSPYVPQRYGVVHGSVIASAASREERRAASNLSTKERKQRRFAKAVGSPQRLGHDDTIPIQLIASNSVLSETPVDFSCLQSSPFVYRGDDIRRREVSNTQDSPLLKRVQEPVTASRYIPCRSGGLGPSYIGSSEWCRAVSQERRRKEYGSLLRVSWQLKAQRRSANIFRDPQRHLRAYSHDFDT